MHFTKGITRPRRPSNILLSLRLHMTVPQQTSGELDLGEPQQRDSNLSNSRPTSETLGSGELPYTQNTGHGPIEIEKPFSIYTNREKWYMVGMAALAGLFRCALSIPRRCAVIIYICPLFHETVLWRPPCIFPPFPLWQTHSIKVSNLLT
jgi:hypothetical protein